MTSDYMPDQHYQNLAEIENYYWWHVGRFVVVSGLVERLLQSGQLNLNGQVLDAGCGTGGFLRNLCKRFGFKNGLGIDGSEQALQAARAIGVQTQLVDLQGEAMAVAQPSQLITCMDVLEHLPGDQKLVKQMFANLQSGGYLIVTVPAFPFLYSSWDKVLGHFRRYRKRDLTALLEKEGFVVLRASYFFSYAFFVSFVRLMNQKHSAQNCEFPAVPGWLNRILLAASKVESVLIRYLPIPFGTSLVCLAFKK